MSKINKAAVGIFAAGFAVGTIGLKLLTSKDAKKAYTHGTAAVLRAKDFVMKTVSTVSENCSDIYADAKSINEDRAAKEEAVYDEFTDDFSDIKNEEEVKEETKAE